MPRAAVPAASSIRIGLDLSDLASALLWASVSPRAPDFVHSDKARILILVNRTAITGASPLGEHPTSCRSRLSPARKTTASLGAAGIKRPSASPGLAGRRVPRLLTAACTRRCHLRDELRRAGTYARPRLRPSAPRGPPYRRPILRAPPVALRGLRPGQGRPRVVALASRPAPGTHRKWAGGAGR